MDKSRGKKVRPFPTQLLFPYPGSKFGLGEAIAKRIPPHGRFVSVFGGTGAEFAFKTPSAAEVYNDLDDSVNSVFSVMQDDEMQERLVALWENTPHGRKQYIECRKLVMSPGPDQVKNAWAFLLCSITGYAGVHPVVSNHWAGGHKRSTVARVRNLPAVLEQWRQRFLHVKVEHDSWQNILRRYDTSETLFFVDPPYHPDVCHHNLYRLALTAEQHQELLQSLRGLKGKVMLCGYPHGDYDKLLVGWHVNQFPTRVKIGKGKPVRIETLWMNYDPENRSAPACPKEPAPSTIPISQTLELSDVDEELLDNITERRNTLASMLRGVVDGDTTAFFCYGPGGHGKSKLIREVLAGHNKVKIWSCDMSARGLVDVLEEFPGHIHFFEDLEKVYRDTDCQGILIAACGGKRGSKRIVQWHKHRVSKSFEFTGGIIISSNTRLDSKPGRLGAVASRFSPQQWKLSDPELAALMQQIALTESKEYGLTQAEAWEIANFVITEMERRSGQGKIDLRTYCEQAIPDFKQWKDGRTSSHWHALVRARINGAPVHENRAHRTERLQYLACQIAITASGRTALNLWQQQTKGEGRDGGGLGRQAYYDRLKEAKESGLYDQIVRKNQEVSA